MEEIISHALENGYKDFPPTPILDGAVHRFGKKDRHWYIGSVCHTEKGEAYNIVTIGDWAGQLEQTTYKPNKRFSKVDKASIEAKLEEQRKKLEAEKTRRAMEAEKTAQEMWSNATNKIDGHGYLLNKKINTKLPLGAKILGNEILIPCRRIDKTLAGLQRIKPDGFKMFLKGQRNNAVFHTIGTIELSNDINLCEGFSTGASIYEATKNPTVVAFNASNMVDVAKELVAKYPDKNIFVCGDDDFKNDVNTGTDYAFKASKYTRIEPIFPVFKDQNNRGTDFNDLHCIEGIEAVKKLFEETPEKEGFEAIGFDDEYYYFYRTDIFSIRKIKSFTEQDFLGIADLDYWREIYQAGKRIDWTEAKNNLIQDCMAKGIYNPINRRGFGVWWDEGRFILNTGRELILDGKIISRSKLKTKYLYVQTRRHMSSKLPEPLSVDECKILVDISSRFNWKDDQDAFFLLGWIAVARLAGSLPIRPFIWITGQKGSGKSTIMESIIQTLLASSKYYARGQGDTSEAGIRQQLASDSVPIVHDEFELDNERSFKRNEAKLALFRGGHTRDGAEIVKGTPSGNIVIYQLNFCGVLASIRVSLKGEADRSRFSILELDTNTGKVDEWQKLEKDLAIHINEEFAERLFSRSLAQAQNIVTSYKILKPLIAGKVNQRYGDQHGILIAGYWSLISDEPLTEEMAEELLFGFDFSDDAKEEKENSDELGLLYDLLTSRVEIGGDVQYGKDTIGRLILDKVRCQGLLAYGIRVKHDELCPQGGYFFVANKHREIARILRDTPFSIGWHNTLSRIPESVRETARKFKNEKKPSRSIGLPISLVNEMFGEELNNTVQDDSKKPIKF